MSEHSEARWQNRDGAFYFLCALFACSIVGTVLLEVYAAVNGNRGVMEAMVFTFVFAALMISGLSCGFRRQRLLSCGVAFWTILLVLFSFAIPTLPQPNDQVAFSGMVLRGQAMSVAFFAGAYWWWTKQTGTQPQTKVGSQGPAWPANANDDDPAVGPTRFSAASVRRSTVSGNMPHCKHGKAIGDYEVSTTMTPRMLYW